ncbi:MAG: 5-formyltetrahydrofolate cyclo-ligase [Actinobacteria bacterium]|nr:5-formyltetrahydrofolate cyclo-ligase [Actinomycetota bacterium]
MKEKQKIRQKMISLRNNLSREEVLLKSNLIKDALIQMPELKNAEWIMLYVSFDNEVRTDQIAKELFGLKKKVLVPAIIKKPKGLIACQVFDFEKDLKAGFFGIKEPTEELKTPFDPQKIDVIIVPGIAFDIRGNRVGFGGGYYDLFLKKLNRKTISIALAYDFQVLKNIPSQKNDVPVDIIVSEKQIIRIH